MKWLRLSLGFGLCFSSMALMAQELDIHGSFAQGYVVSDGNNSYGNSLHGSRDLYEVALNARTTLTPKILVSGQVMARRAGADDDGKLRVDFAQIDYQFYSGLNGDAGLRLGRLKNPYGFYNDSRDVVFSRPGITMPSAVYFEGVGLRNLFFASDGAQLYGHVSHGQYASDLTLGWSRDSDATEDFQKFLSPQGLEGTVRISKFQLAQWLHEWDAGKYRAGISYLGAKLGFRPDDPQASAAQLDLDATLLAFSFQVQSETSSLTAEYLLSTVQIDNPVMGRSKSHGDGAYVQYRRSFTPDWASYLRYDLSFSNRNDRDGREYAAATGRPRHSQFSRDHVLGVQWTPTANWGLFVEYHYTDGTANVRAIDNQGRELQRYSQTTLAVLAYQF